MSAVAPSYAISAGALPVHRVRAWWKAWAAIGLVSVGFVFLATFRLTSFPEPDTDESWDAAPAYTLLKEGALRNPVLAGREYYDQHVVRPRLTLTMLVAGAFKLLGPGLWQGRLVSVVFGCLTLLATWWYTRRVFDTSLALLASALLATDASMLQMSRLIRPEIIEAALAMVALIALTHGLETRQSSSFVISGVLVGIGLYTHAAMTFIAAAFLVPFAVHWGVACVRRRHLWIFIASVGVGLLPYVAYLIWQDGGNGFAHFRAQLSQHGRAVLDTQAWWSVNLESAYQRYWNFIGSPFGVLPFLLGLAGIAVAALSANHYLEDLAIVCVVYSIGVALLIHEPMAAYLMPIAPMMVILEANLLLTLYRAPAPPAAWRILGLALVCLLFANHVGRIGAWAWKYRRLDFASYSERLRAASLPSDGVWAPLELWSVFREHDMRSEFTNLMEFPRGNGDAPLDAQRMTFKPDLIILPEHAQYPSSHERLRRIAAALNATVTSSFDDPYYGRTDILRIPWRAESGAGQ